MIGTVRIGEKEVEMAANAASPFVYKQLFKKDFIVMLDKLQSGKLDDENANLFVEMGFIMAKQAEAPDISKLMQLKMEDFYKWLEGFEPMEVILASDAIARLYNGQKDATSVPKNEGE